MGFCIFIYMDRFDKIICKFLVVLFILDSILIGIFVNKKGIFDGVTTPVHYEHFIEVTFPQMEKSNGTH